ncbi:hypothetical protein K432DRAFT_462929 [Lepidopterella palustris CBS 459.81]|uniref:MFS general substrate transporter n=1 Tax=Lepidopterella palustris CBS 459.81 TaxID=1314670 RepID=A0A8E2E3D0_9PEZI|nr:hypothetical protein K432DRAFT_462929 [Lepidopterella palustris CBS 459.81]
MGSTWASSLYYPAARQISDESHVGIEVSALGLAFFLFVFSPGPLLWAPLSKAYGRKPVVLAPYFIAAIFSFSTVTAKDIQTVLITGLFTGLFGSVPVTNTSQYHTISDLPEYINNPTVSVLGDIWPPQTRDMAIVGYVVAVMTEYITGIMIIFILTLEVLILDESCPAVLLVCRKYLIRPFQMLLTQICFLVALCASFVYGILYANLATFPIVFQQERSWSQIVGALPFLAQLTDILIGTAANVLNPTYYYKRWEANNLRSIPKAWLPPMILGSIVFGVGLFIFGWTAITRIYWIAANIGVASVNYLLDTFHNYAASANLGVGWGINVLNGILPGYVVMPELVI